MKDLLLKYLAWIGLICIFLIIIVIVVNKTSLKNNNSSLLTDEKYKNTYLSSTREYEQIDFDKIKSIEISSLTETSKRTVTDIEQIRNIYIMLGNVYINKETTERTIDDDTIITFIEEDNTNIEFHFNSSNLILNDIYYNTTGLKKEILLIDN